MLNKGLIRTFRTAGMLAVLFVLAPCPVKKSLYAVFDTVYNSPLNKTRATIAPFNSCSKAFSEQTGKKAGMTIPAKQLLSYRFRYAAFPAQFHVPATSLIHKYWRHIAAKSPPRYILFKRLKLHTA